MNLPFDLSGSRAKNRFRNELLWGLKKMLELHKEGDDFTMVFDYSCDIEIHKKDGLEFYQLKTQNSSSSYTIDKILKPSKTGDSIFGKLYILKYDSRKKEKDDIKISLVCNAPLSDGKKTFNNVEIVNMATIDSAAVNKIKEKMKNELKLTKEIKLKNSHYEKTSMDLIYPEKTLIGEIVLFFVDTFKSEPKKVNMLFKMLQGEIERKASFELAENNYESILEKKGVSKTYLDGFLHDYKDTADIAIEKSKKFIEDHYKDDFHEKLSLLRAISQMMSQLSQNNMQLTLLEEEIKNYFSEENIVNLPKKEGEIIEEICKEMIPNKPIEISNSEIKALVILVMKKLEEEVYEI